MQRLLVEGVYSIRHADSPDSNPQGNTTVIIGAGPTGRCATFAGDDPHNQEYCDESIEGLIKDAFYQAPK